MERLLIAVAIAVVAIAVAALAQRRRPDSPTSGSGHVPMQVDRNDFADPTRAWALLVFTSATCASCAEVWKQASAVEHEQLVVADIELEAAKDIHDRYRVDAVPLTLLVDHLGVTQKWFLGPTAPKEIAKAVSQAIG